MQKEPLYKRLYYNLRVLENEAYGSVISAFRSQGELTWEKQKVLSQLQEQLSVSNNRHDIELLRTEHDPMVQKLVANNIHTNRQEILQGDLSSIIPPPPLSAVAFSNRDAQESEIPYVMKKKPTKKSRSSSFILPPPPALPQPVIQPLPLPELIQPKKVKSKAKPKVTKKRRKGGLAIIPSPPPRSRKRQRNLDPVSLAEVKELQPPAKVQKVQKQKRRVEKKFQPQLPPPPGLPPKPPVVEIFPYDIDLNTIETFEDVQNFVDEKHVVMGELEKDWTDDKDLKQRETLMSRLRSERFRLLQVINHVDNTL